MVEWQNRPLDRVYPVLFIDAINVKIREGQVANRPIYVAIGVTVDGERDILGLWAGDGGEGAKFWHHVLTEIKNRGVADVCMLVCDGLTGLPDAVSSVWPQTIVQTCVVHLLRNSFRYASRRDWPQIAKGLKPIYSAADGGRGAGAPRRVRRAVGGPLPGDREAVGGRLGRVRAVLELRPGDPHRDLHDERDRERERTDPQGGQGPRAFPDRDGGDQVCLPGGDEPRPDRQGPPTLVEPVESRAECLYNRLPRPYYPCNEIAEIHSKEQNQLHR